MSQVVEQAEMRNQLISVIETLGKKLPAKPTLDTAWPEIQSSVREDAEQQKQVAVDKLIDLMEQMVEEKVAKILEGWR